MQRNQGRRWLATAFVLLALGATRLALNGRNYLQF